MNFDVKPIFNRHKFTWSIKSAKKLAYQNHIKIKQIKSHIYGQAQGIKIYEVITKMLGGAA